MDEPTFEHFAVRAMPSLLRSARVLTGNEHDAADLVQDTLVRVGTRWSRIDAESSPLGYNHTVLARLNIDRLRRLRRELIRATTQDSATRDQPYEGLDPWMIDAWRSLTANERTCVALRYLDDMDVADIAARLGCTSSTVRSHISRGLARLRNRVPTNTQEA